MLGACFQHAACFCSPPAVKIVVTRALLITADLLSAFALGWLLLGLECIKFLKDQPQTKLKMRYLSGLVLGVGSKACTSVGIWL